jgi:flagellar biosynthesis GTPase FlhF
MAGSMSRSEPASSAGPLPQAVDGLSTALQVRKAQCHSNVRNSVEVRVVAVKTSKSDVEPVDAGAAAQIGNVGNGLLPGGDAVGVDKIRDLLFGNQMQDYDRRFSKLEERFLQRFKDIESETARNLNAFESNAKKQVESLASQLREEKDLRSEADKEIDRTLREQHQAVEKRLRSISDQVSQLERDMSDRLVQEALSLREEIKRKTEDIQHAIEKMFSELSNVKTDRNLLAGLFVEVAKCLNQDVGPKSVGKGGGDRGWTSS